MADIEEAPPPASLSVREPLKSGLEYSEPLKTGSDFSPAKLATEAKKSAHIKGWRLPLWAVLLGTFIFIISVIVIPASEIFITNAHSNVEDTAQVILEISASKCVGDIKELLMKFEAVAHGFGKRPSTTQVIANALAGAQLQDQVLNNLDWPREFAFFMSESYPVTTVACLGNSGPNPTSVVQTAMDFVPYPAIMVPDNCVDAGITTCAYYTNRTYTFDFMDTTTLADGGLTYWKFILDEKGLLTPDWLRALIYDSITDPALKAYIGSPDPRVPIRYLYFYPNFYPVATDPNYQIMQASNPIRENGSHWNVGILAGTQELYGSVSKLIYQDDRRDAKPTHGCQAGGDIATSLGPFLTASVPSPGGVVFLYDTKISPDSTPNTTAGAMIASSVPGSFVSSDGVRCKIAPNAYHFARKLQHTYCRIMLADTCASSPSALVSNVGKFLFRVDATLNFAGTQTFKADLAGRSWYIATQRLEVDTFGNAWIVVVAFPREDFFAAIDRSIQQNVIIIGCLVAAAVLLVVVLSFAFTVPLSKLVARMEEVTQMRFSALGDKTLEARSFVREIALMEEKFHIMVQAFAAGIKKNAGLLTANSSRHQPPHTTGSMGSNTTEGQKVPGASQRVQSHYYEDPRRAPIFADPYGRSYTMIAPGPVWCPPPPPMPMQFEPAGPGPAAGQITFYTGPVGAPAGAYGYAPQLAEPLPFGPGDSGMAFYAPPPPPDAGGAGYVYGPTTYEPRPFGPGPGGRASNAGMGMGLGMGMSMGMGGRSGYGVHDGGPAPESTWDRKDRIKTSYSSNGGQRPIHDYPPDPDVRGFDEYKQKWDDLERHKRFEKDVVGWGPTPKIEFDPLLMWNTPEISQAIGSPKVKREPGIKSEPVEYSYDKYTHERSNRFQSDNHVPPAYDEEHIPSPAAAVGSHGRAGDERDRSVSPSAQRYSQRQFSYPYRSFDNSASGHGSSHDAQDGHDWDHRFAQSSRYGENY
ncbi:hypothetical protein HDU88_000956 [Geranomyces variabilis]|nr:hypothetical protein HDU88_000956 [Geranomyces variabilis]